MRGREGGRVRGREGGRVRGREGEGGREGRGGVGRHKTLRLLIIETMYFTTTSSATRASQHSLWRRTLRASRWVQRRTN